MTYNRSRHKMYSLHLYRIKNNLRIKANNIFIAQKKEQVIIIQKYMIYKIIFQEEKQKNRMELFAQTKKKNQNSRFQKNSMKF